jgi:hypothetical protein
MSEWQARAPVRAKPSAVYANRMQRYSDEVWLIWSNKWGCWYRPKCQGYTNDIGQAGLYDRETAARHYPGAVPRKHRDVEPFPLSSVRRLLGRRAEQARAEAEQAEALAATLAALIAPAPPAEAGREVGDG